jgi:hypothetical protein
MVSFKLQALFMTVVAAMVSAHPSLRDYTDISGGSDTPYCSVETVNDESKIRIMYEFTQSGNTFTSAEPSDSVCPPLYVLLEALHTDSLFNRLPLLPSLARE